MLNKRIIGFILIVAMALIFCNLALANTTDVLPTLTLTVNQLPPTAIPQMCYTAQLSFMPANPTNQLVVDFYNINPANSQLEFLGSVPFTNLGKAELIKQIMPGRYTGIAKTVINGIVIWSNKVEYVAN